MNYVFCLLLIFVGCPLLASDEEVVAIEIVDHKFVPDEIIVTSGKRIKLVVKNKDSTIEEFESFDLNREKLVPGNSEIKVIFGPLKPGIYKFFGEFHEKTAQGKIVVK